VDGLPTAAALVPEPKKISEAVVPETSRMDDALRAEDSGKPALTRRLSPNCNNDICTNNQTTAFVDGMQAPTHIIHIDAKSSERLRFDIDVAEFDRGRLEAETSLLRCRSIPASQTGHFVLYQMVSAGGVMIQLSRIRS
jgi:hypothetical protein